MHRRVRRRGWADWYFLGFEVVLLAAMSGALLIGVQVPLWSCASGLATPELSGRLLVVVALLAALAAPFTTDAYPPAFPAMTVELGASASMVQLTLTAFLLGAGLRQLVFGPLSDRVGQRAPLIVGTAVCVAAGLVAVFAVNITVLIVARLGQGLSGPPAWCWAGRPSPTSARGARPPGRST